MTLDEARNSQADRLDGLALGHLGLGSSVLAVFLQITNEIRRGDASISNGWAALSIASELPDVPPRTGDCAELLDM